MPRYISPHDGAELFYRDYVPAAVPHPFKANPGTASIHPKPVLVFLHGWPMSSRMWEQLLVPLCETYRFRCIAPDRRGFGSSDWNGARPTQTDINYNTFADDVAHLLDSLDVHSFVFVAASMGCGEGLYARARSHHVQEYCKGFIWIGPSMPFPLQTSDNPMAPSRELWDSILESVRQARPEFVHAALPGVFGMQLGVEVGGKTLQHFEQIVDQADALAMERCIQIIITVDFTRELEKLAISSEVPVMILHGESDQGMPFEASTKLIEELMPRTQVKIYGKAGHGLYLTHTQQVLEDILGFLSKL